MLWSGKALCVGRGVCPGAAPPIEYRVMGSLLLQFVNWLGSPVPSNEPPYSPDGQEMNSDD